MSNSTLGQLDAYAVAKAPFALGARLVGDTSGLPVAIGSPGVTLLAGTPTVRVGNRPVRKTQKVRISTE